MDKSCIAVLCAYWPERYPNIYAGIECLRSGTVQPEKIIVFNNNPAYILEYDSFGEDVVVVNSSGNFTSRSKYAVALLEPSPYYALLDDDVMVREQTVEVFLDHAFPGCALSDMGVILRTNMISEGFEVKGLETRFPAKVDAFIGRFQLLSFEGIIRVLQAENKVRLPFLPLFRSVGEDILAAAANEDAYVIPLNYKSCLSDGIQGSRAMQHDWGYYQFRDAFNYAVRRDLGLEVFPTYIPGSDEHDQRLITSYLQTVSDRDLETNT